MGGLPLPVVLSAFAATCWGLVVVVLAPFDWHRARTLAYLMVLPQALTSLTAVASIALQLALVQIGRSMVPSWDPIGLPGWLFGYLGGDSWDAVRLGGVTLGALAWSIGLTSGFRYLLLRRARTAVHATRWMLLVDVGLVFIAMIAIYEPWFW